MTNNAKKPPPYSPSTAFPALKMGHRSSKIGKNMNELVYQDQYVKLFHGDYRAVLPSLNVSDFDCVLLDPPFDIWEEVGPGEFEQIPKKIIFTNWQHRAVVENHFGQPRSEFVWYFKDGRWVSHRLPIQAHELICIYGETGEAYVGEKNEDRTPQNKGSGSVGRDTYDERIYVPRERKMLRSVLEYPRNLRNGMGAWGKPEGLIRNLLEFVSPNQVLDTFAGGGSTLVVAKELKIKAVGIELEEKNCELAISKLEKAPTLFDGG